MSTYSTQVPKYRHFSFFFKGPYVPYDNSNLAGSLHVTLRTMGLIKSQSQPVPDSALSIVKDVGCDKRLINLHRSSAPHMFWNCRCKKKMFRQTALFRLRLNKALCITLIFTHWNKFMSVMSMRPSRSFFDGHLRASTSLGKARVFPQFFLLEVQLTLLYWPDLFCVIS